MLGEDEKVIPDGALLPRLHGTLVTVDSEHDMRSDAARLLMRRPSGLPWLQKAAADKKNSGLILTGLKREIELARPGEFLPLSEKGPMIAKRYRDIIISVLSVLDVDSSLRSQAEQLSNLLVREEQSREKRLKEFLEKKESSVSYPSSAAYPSIIKLREKARFTVALPFSERRERSEASMSRVMASRRAKSESARHTIAS